MKVELTFDTMYIDYLNKKFDIKDEDDLVIAIAEMIATYMEM